MVNNKKIPELYIILAILGTMGIFVLGMVDWNNHPKEAGTWQANMYYLTICTTLYMCGVIFFMQANTLFSKVASFIAIIIFGWNFYVELYGNPRWWSDWNKAGVTLSITCACLVCGIIEKIKSIKNG